MATPIKKDYDYYITNLDWDDGSELEFTDNPKKFDRLDNLEHTYEMPGYYSVKGLIYKKALYMVNAYPPRNEDMTIDYEEFDRGEIELDGGEEGATYTQTVVRSKGVESDYFNLSELFYEVSTEYIPASTVPNYNLFPLSNGNIYLTTLERYPTATEAFINTVRVQMPALGNREKEAGLRMGVNIFLDRDKNNLFQYGFNAWLPDYGNTEYEVFIEAVPGGGENGEFSPNYNNKKKISQTVIGTNSWQTITGEYYHTDEEKIVRLYVYIRQKDRFTDVRLDADGEPNLSWAFYVKNIEIKFQNQRGLEFPLEWERFTSKFIVNPSTEYVSPMFEKNGFLLIGGLSKNSYHYKSLSSIVGYDYNTGEKKNSFSYGEYNPYDIITSLDTLAKYDDELYDEYLDSYSFGRQDDDGNTIHKGVIDKKWHGVFKNTSLTQTDISTTKLYRGVKPMWQQLGFDNDEFDKPNRNIYWKNIIPKDFDLSERVGITQRDLPDPMKGSLIPRIPRKEFIVDEEATQYWKDGYYWPALPKFNKYGGFSDEYPQGTEEQTYGNVGSGIITDMNANNADLIINMSFDEDGLKETNEDFTLENITDFSLKINSNNRIVKSVEDFTDSIDVDTNKQAF